MYLFLGIIKKIVNREVDYALGIHKVVFGTTVPTYLIRGEETSDDVRKQSYE